MYVCLGKHTYLKTRDARIHERGLSHTMKHAPLRDLPPPKAGMYVRMYVCMHACMSVRARDHGGGIEVCLYEWM